MKNTMSDTTVNKIAKASPNMRTERIEQLKTLFPDLFDGEGQLDEKALRALISDEVGIAAERFSFEWAGKQQSKRLAFTPSRATLTYDPTRSLNSDGTENKAGETPQQNTSENLIIEGDNLEVLKLLQATYFEQVKCIYIDPPYNTGNDFIYPDNFTEGKKAYWEKNGTVKEGIKLTALPETHGRRHSDWLNFMQSRLLLARQMLREDGVIFVSIDDNEAHNLRKLMDEIFGEDNFISKFVVQTNPRGRSLDKFVAKTFEYILCYAKDCASDAIKNIPKDTKALKEYNKEDEKGKFRLLELRNRNPVFNRQNRPNLYYPIYVCPIDASVSLNKSEKHSEEALPLNSKNEDGCWTWSSAKFEKNSSLLLGRKTNTGIWRVFRKDYIPEEGATTKEKSLWLDSNLNHENGKEELGRLFEKSGNTVPFDFPKSVELIKKCVAIGVYPNDIFVDFFAGSGTSAHAVMQKNSEDGGNRKHIMVQIPELTDEKSEAYKAGYKRISDITIERVKRAGAKIREENPDTKIDTGFRVFKLTHSNFSENLFTPDEDKSDAENIKALETHLAEAAQMRLFDTDKFSNLVTEISLKNGFGLFYQLEPMTDFSHNKIYRLHGNGKTALLCLDNNLHDASVENLKPFNEEQLIVSKSALDTSKKFSLQTEFKDNLWVV
jgi:adenine-specific DNA-methyltransferase